MWNPFSSNALSTLGKASKNAGRQIHGSFWLLFRYDNGCLAILEGEIVAVASVPFACFFMGLGDQTGYQGQKYQINNLFHNNHGIYKVYIGETNVHKMLILCKSNL